MLLNETSYFKFSGGEVHCKAHAGVGVIKMQDYTMNGFMALAEFVEVRKRLEGDVPKVIYPYFPYARQDRVMTANEPFSLKIFCNLVNSLDIPQIVVYDPHSDVTPALLNNCSTVSQHKIAKKAIPKEFLEDHNVLIVSPDAGAYKKVSKLITDDRRIVLGSKVRNAKGEIIRTSVHSPVELKNKHCIIVDDICDGGRTFMALAHVLKEQGASLVSLYVTHGIFSQGLLPLSGAGIDNVYTTDSFIHDEGKWFEKDEIAKMLHVYKIPETFHDVD